MRLIAASPPSAGIAAGVLRPACVLAALVLLGSASVAAGASVYRVWLLLAIAPLLEEAAFRAGLQEALLRWTKAPWVANVSTAIAFGVVHAAVRGDIGAFAVVLPALLIGFVYERSRKLRHCVALHAAMNAFWLLWTMSIANTPAAF